MSRLSLDYSSKSAIINNGSTNVYIVVVGIGGGIFVVLIILFKKKMIKSNGTLYYTHMSHAHNILCGIKVPC